MPETDRQRLQRRLAELQPAPCHSLTGDGRVVCARARRYADIGGPVAGAATAADVPALVARLRQAEAERDLLRDRDKALAVEMDISNRLKVELDDVRAERDKALAEADELRQMEPLGSREVRAALAAARRDGAADALEWFAAEHPLCSGHHRAQLNAWATEVRAGVRTIPTTTEESDHADH